MANLIKKKFIGNDQVDGDKVLLLFGQDVRRLDSEGVEYNGFENVEELISLEETRALTAEQDLQDQINSINASTGLQDEIDRATAAEADLQSQITTEKNRVDAILSGADADLDTFAEVVALINSIDTDNDDAFAGYVLSNDARVLAVEGEVDTLQADVSSLDAALIAEIEDRTTLEGEFDQYVLDNDARVALVEADVSSLDAALVAEIQDRIDGDSALDVRVSAIEAVQWYTEKVTITAFQLADGFIDLSFAPEAGSVIAFVDRLAIFEGANEDFTMNGARMTFLNQLVSPGNQALQDGDEIRVKYRA